MFQVNLQTKLGHKNSTRPISLTTDVGRWTSQKY